MTENEPKAASGSEQEELVITRLLSAPREQVFRAWTDPARLVRWFAPQGCAIEFRQLDPRSGGVFHSCIRVPGGKECWCRGVYREVVAPERIVYSMAVADKDGNLISPAQAGMDPDWPAETILTVTFTDEAGKTRLTLHQTVRETLARRTGAGPSWLQMLDRLEEELK